jgi:hypothetical protein
MAETAPGSKGWKGPYRGDFLSLAPMRPLVTQMAIHVEPAEAYAVTHRPIGVALESLTHGRFANFTGIVRTGRVVPAHQPAPPTLDSEPIPVPEEPWTEADDAQAFPPASAFPPRTALLRPTSRGSRPAIPRGVRPQRPTTPSQRRLTGLPMAPAPTALPDLATPAAITITSDGQVLTNRVRMRGGRSASLAKPSDTPADQIVAQPGTPRAVTPTPRTPATTPALLSEEQAPRAAPSRRRDLSARHRGQAPVDPGPDPSEPMTPPRVAPAIESPGSSTASSRRTMPAASTTSPQGTPPSVAQPLIPTPGVIQRRATGTPATAQPPTAQPPTAQPPTAQPPTAQPPTAQPPTAQPPTAQPSTPMTDTKPDPARSPGPAPTSNPEVSSPSDAPSTSQVSRPSDSDRQIAPPVMTTKTPAIPVAIPVVRDELPSRTQATGSPDASNAPVTQRRATGTPATTAAAEALSRVTEESVRVPSDVQDAVAAVTGERPQEVRVRRGPAVNRTAARIAADSYATEGVVHLPGTAPLSTDRSRRLLAHELTHVVQQKSSSAPRNEVSSAGRDAEQQALRAESALEHGRGPTPRSASAPQENTMNAVQGAGAPRKAVSRSTSPLSPERAAALPRTTVQSPLPAPRTPLATPRAEAAPPRAGDFASPQSPGIAAQRAPDVAAPSDRSLTTHPPHPVPPAMAPASSEPPVQRRSAAPTPPPPPPSPPRTNRGESSQESPPPKGKGAPGVGVDTATDDVWLQRHAQALYPHIRYLLRNEFLLDRERRGRLMRDD